VEELYSGLYVAHPIVIRVHGDDYARLKAYAAEIKERLRAQPGSLDVTDNLTDEVLVQRLDMDVLAASRLGISAARAGELLRALYGRDRVTEFSVGDERVDVILENAPPVDAERAVEEARIVAASGAAIPISAFAALKAVHEPAQLMRRNLQRMVEIVADVTGSSSPDTVLEPVQAWLLARSWEPGYGVTFGGAEAEEKDSFAKLGMAALGALVLIFALLVILFGSFRLSGAVIAAVPFGLVGALAGLAIVHRPFGFMAFLGLIALMAVYVNHKIYLVDRVRELLDRGYAAPRAIVQAGVDRVRPVILTALTAVLGLLPLGLQGGNMWSSFVWANVFGLLASIPLSLVLLPALVAISLGRESAARPERSPLADFVADVAVPEPPPADG
jgi:multidrug efflux pump subunit AcrB